MSFLFYKVLHVLCVIGFVGGIATNLYWGAVGARAKSQAFLGNTFKGMRLVDRTLIGPCSIILVITGFGATAKSGYGILQTGWIFWGIVVFVAAMVVFGAFIAPLQKKLSRVGDESVDDTTVRSMYRRWQVWTALGLIMVTFVTVLMTLKPAIPGVG